MPSALAEVSSAVVPLAVAKPYFAPSICAQVVSNWCAKWPSSRFHLPVIRTSIQPFSSFFSITGHDGNGFVRTGLPPRIARPAPPDDDDDFGVALGRARPGRSEE